jgi:prevent-host-death family protein
MMAKGASTVKTIPALVARNEFGTILKRVKGNKERFVVSRKGEAAAVILGYEDFVRSVLKIKEPVTLRTIRKQARRSGVSKLSLEEINAEIRAAREERREKLAS